MRILQSVLVASHGENPIVFRPALLQHSANALHKQD